MPSPNIVEWLNNDLASRQHFPSEEAVACLVEDAERAVRRYLEQEIPLRPSAAVREFNNLNKHFTGAANAMKRLGKLGLVAITAASGTGGDVGGDDLVRHILYIERMAALNGKAAHVAAEQSRSVGDGRGLEC